MLSSTLGLAWTAADQHSELIFQNGGANPCGNQSGLESPLRCDPLATSHAATLEPREEGVGRPLDQGGPSCVPPAKGRGAGVGAVLTCLRVTVASRTEQKVPAQ
eukprot:4133157-Amphidinium_carterae.1